MTENLPDHLGGHLNKTHNDRGTLLYLKKKYNINSMLDIGCGPGGMVQLAKDRGINAFGIDGDFTLEYPPELSPFILIHDFTQGPAPIDSKFDLGWSVEFLEHVEEQYQDNYMQAFAACDYVVATAAPPGYPGHHHVNCRDQEYWIEVFARYGFEFDENETKQISTQSTMMKPFMQTTGMFFRKKQ